MIDRATMIARQPMLVGFLATALQDLQHTEADKACMEERDERDSGTIYNCPDATFARAQLECENFAKAAGPTLDLIRWPDMEAIGSDLYLERAGHGSGFRDRTYSDDRDESRAIGEALSGSVEPRGSLEMYMGDDGCAWIVGAESVA